MQNWKNILFKILWSIAAVALVVLFVIAWQAKGSKQCKDIQVELVGNSTKALFLYEQEILGLINDEHIKVGDPITKINLGDLEKKLEQSGWIKNAELFIDNKMVLQVKIEQRTPIARVFTVGGNSFYMDNEGRRLPLRQLSVLRLPVFTGFTSDQPVLSKPDSALLLDMVYFANTIKSDTFFTAQIAQINIESNGDFELIPTIGDHLILIGKVDKLEDKLNRLYTFYKNVWVPSGINAFQVLDCRFDKQIVALKKGLQPIQFTGSSMHLTSLATVMDSTIKSDTIKPKKVIVKPKIVKMPTKLNNKANLKTLNKVKKTAKALMPKKSESKPTTIN